ncbi:DUF4124 domain-containing protein [Neptuniibacter halophilus]|uniref:DUF4124 domain-containing protein n=1 Tax=Neptuniibacter halophilus TaxID=651666 RepID=UPI00257427EF|nr:DUF4124 domain-containing protein [Neptuniibacter halophilus]
MALSPTLAVADIYSWVDEQGVRHFSDKPPQGAARSAVRGEVQSKASRAPINAMQPFKPVIQPETASASETPADTAKGGDSSAESEPESRSAGTGSNNKSDLKRLSQQKSGYSVQKRVAEIKAEKAQAIADKKAIQQGSATKDFSKPDKLSKKLKNYNDAKGAQ